MKINTYVKNENHYLSILNSILGQLSDGIWENSKAAEKYWKSLSIDVDDNNNIIIEDRYGVCPDPVAYIANKIKHVLKIEKDDGNSKIEWDRNCSTISSYIGYSNPVTVGECYKLYDLLKHRDVSKKNYTIYQNYSVKISCLPEPKIISVIALRKSDARQIAAQKLVEEFMKSAEISLC